MKDFHPVDDVIFEIESTDNVFQEMNDAVLKIRYVMHPFISNRIR